MMCLVWCCTIIVCQPVHSLCRRLVLEAVAMCNVKASLTRGQFVVQTVSVIPLNVKFGVRGFAWVTKTWTGYMKVNVRREGETTTTPTTHPVGSRGIHIHCALVCDRIYYIPWWSHTLVYYWSCLILIFWKNLLRARFVLPLNLPRTRKSRHANHKIL